MGQPGENITILDATYFDQDYKPKPHWVRSRTRRNHWSSLDPTEFANYPKLEPLPYLRECRLIERAKSGDVEARNEVWVHHLRLVYAVMNRFHIHENDLPDALQEGAMGLCRAIERFDVHRYNAFSTYAWFWVGQRIRRYAHTHGYRIRIPAHLEKDYRRFRRELARCHTPSEWFDLRLRWLERGEKVYMAMIRLHLLAEPEPVEAAMGMMCNGVEPIETMILAEFPRAIALALGELDERERFIITRRFGCDGGPLDTLQQVADRLGLTRERVRQIQTDTIVSLREALDPNWPCDDGLDVAESRDCQTNEDGLT